MVTRSASFSGRTPIWGIFNCIASTCSAHIAEVKTLGWYGVWHRPHLSTYNSSESEPDSGIGVGLHPANSSVSTVSATSILILTSETLCFHLSQFWQTQ